MRSMEAGHQVQGHSLHGSCIACVYPDLSNTCCAGRSRLYTLWSTLPSSTTPCAGALERSCPLSYQTWSGPDSSYLWNSVLCYRFTGTIFKYEQDSFCRSLFSIRKYYLNLWFTMCLSMSAACVTKARLVSSRSYSDHDVS
jgi:hypothetical protein